MSAAAKEPVLKAYQDIDETRAVGLVTSAPAWNAVSGRLGHLHVASHMEVTEATAQHWEAVAKGSLAKKSVRGPLRRGWRAGGGCGQVLRLPA